MSYVLTELHDGKIVDVIRTDKPLEVAASYSYADAVDGKLIAWDSDGNCYQFTTEQTLPGEGETGFSYHTPWHPIMKEEVAAKMSAEQALRDWMKAHKHEGEEDISKPTLTHLLSEIS